MCDSQNVFLMAARVNNVSTYMLGECMCGLLLAVFSSRNENFSSPGNNNNYFREFDNFVYL